MKRAYKLFLIILGLGIIGLALFFFPNRNVGEEVTIKTNYMMYACGECYPQYKVKEIVYPIKGFEFLLNKDISVNYSSKKQEDSIKMVTEKCITCYEFYFTGKVKYSKTKGYVFKARSAKVKLWDVKCCD